MLVHDTMPFGEDSILSNVGQGIELLAIGGVRFIAAGIKAN
jgi:hypothetical protein